MSCQRYSVKGEIHSIQNLDLSDMPVRIIAETYKKNNPGEMIRKEYQISVNGNGKFIIINRFPFDNVQFQPGENWNHWVDIKNYSSDLSYPRFIVNNSNNFVFIDKRGTLENILLTNAVIIDDLPTKFSSLDNLNFHWSRQNPNEYYSVTFISKHLNEAVLIITGLNNPSFEGKNIEKFDTVELGQELEVSNLKNPTIVSLKNFKNGDIFVEIKVYLLNEANKVQVISQTFSTKNKIQFQE